MVLFDCDFLCFLCHDNPGVVLSPTTRKPVEKAPEKIKNLLNHLEAKRKKIIIPTPALSEFLCITANNAHEILDVLTNTYGFELAAFDTMAAVEAAIATSSAVAKGAKKGGSKSTWAKVKFDRQIIAIAKTRGVSTIYSNDDDVRRYAKKDGMEVIPLWSLPEPPPDQPLLPNLEVP